MPAHPGSPGLRAVTRVCVCVFVHCYDGPWKFVLLGQCVVKVVVMKCRRDGGMTDSTGDAGCITGGCVQAAGVV